MKDLHNKIQVVPLIAPVAARTDNTAIVSAIIDRKTFQSLVLALVTGTNTDTNATFTVLVEDGNASNLSDAAAVADVDLNGTELLAGFQFDDDVECRKIGYVGNKRYVRMTVTPVGNDSGNIFLSGIAILSNGDLLPTINPPA